MKIICSGMFANTTVGHIDNLMAYALGFKQLGHDVYVIEDVDAKRCFDADYQPVAFCDWDGRRHFEELTKSYGVWPRCSLIYSGGELTHGLPFTDVKQIANSADLLLLIGGRVKTQEILDSVNCKAYVDINPAKTQVYYAQHDVDYGFDQFDFFFSYGLNLGTSRCDLPTGGLTWNGILPPVFLELWPARIDTGCRRFTTISTWAGRHTFYWQEKFSGEKSDQWKDFVELPKNTSQELEIALKIDPRYADDKAMFAEKGWHLTDPSQLRSLTDYRAYIANSRAEFSVANNRYVDFDTGWVSDRTARYLASAKPVLVQATGIEEQLPREKGFLTFRNMDEAVEGIGAINCDYESHCQAARQIAEEYFSTEKVLPRILDVVGLANAPLTTTSK